MSGSHGNRETPFAVGAQLGQMWWEQDRKLVVTGRSKKRPVPPQSPMETSTVSPSLLGLSFPSLYPGVSRLQVLPVVDSCDAVVLGFLVLTLPSASCVTLGKSLGLSEPQFADLKMRMSVGHGWKKLWDL